MERQSGLIRLKKAASILKLVFLKPVIRNSLKYKGIGNQKLAYMYSRTRIIQ